MTETICKPVEEPEKTVDEPVPQQSANKNKEKAPAKTRWSAGLAFFSVHAACLLVFWAGISWVAVATCLILYYVRAFGITAGYHRYFAHRAFRTSRVFQFILAWIGCSAAQMGPLWWAGHHRTHHRHTDEEGDIHSPFLQGLWWSHVGWIVSGKFEATNFTIIKDFLKYPEIRFLDKYFILPPLVLAVALFGFGAALNAYFPGLGTSGFQMLIWGFFISTVLLYHATFAVNSLAHTIGWRRYKTKDYSTNSFLLALFTMGEGFHNNHHRYPASARQGFYWWEFDATHYILKLLGWMGIVSHLRDVPEGVLHEGRAKASA